MERTRRRFLISTSMVLGGVVGLQIYGRQRSPNTCVNLEEALSCELSHLGHDPSIKNENATPTLDEIIRREKEEPAIDAEPKAKLDLKFYEARRLPRHRNRVYLDSVRLRLENTGRVEFEPRVVLSAELDSRTKKIGEGNLGPLAPGDRPGFILEFGEKETAVSPPAKYTISVFTDAEGLDEQVTEMTFVARPDE